MSGGGPAGPPPRPRRRAGGGGGEPLRLSESLGAVAHRLGVGDAPVVGRVFARWAELVGEGVAAHVRPLRVDGDTLVVAVDHPAWAAQLRHIGPDILARVADGYEADGAPTRLQVKVRR